MEQYLRVFKNAERGLVRRMEPARVAALDEDDMASLHRRVHTTRTMHAGNDRRATSIGATSIGATSIGAMSTGVTECGGRVAVRKANDTAEDRAYVLEGAPARTSDAPARAAPVRAAPAQADLLHGERRAQARKGEGDNGGPVTHGQPRKDSGESDHMSSVDEGGRVGATAGRGGRTSASGPRRKKRAVSMGGEGARTQTRRDAR